MEVREEEEEADYSSVEDLWGKQLHLKSQSDLSLREKNSYTNLTYNRGSRNFSIAFEKLGLEAEEDSSEEMGPIGRTQETQTCQCDDCAMDECRNITFKSREISTLKLMVQGPEVLNHQGIRHPPQDLAPFWKKDSRMWLWKSVRLARNRKLKARSLTKFPSVDYGFDKP